MRITTDNTSAGVRSVVKLVDGSPADLETAARMLETPRPRRWWSAETLSSAPWKV